MRARPPAAAPLYSVTPLGVDPDYAGDFYVVGPHHFLLRCGTSAGAHRIAARKNAEAAQAASAASALERHFGVITDAPTEPRA
jgi:hypothetical protein